MNIFSTIVVDVEKFFKGTGTDVEKFAASFWKLFKKVPAALQVIQNFVGEVAPIITAAVGLADPILEPEAAAALAALETGLAAVDAAATAATTGTSLLANIEGFAGSVPQLLTGIAIKNPALQAEITKIVNLVEGEAKVIIPAIQAWVQQIQGSAPAAS